MTISPDLRRRLGTTVAVAFSCFATLMTAMLAGYSDVADFRIALGTVLNLGAAVALVWRKRWPWPVLALSVVGPILFVTDGTAALIALFTVLRSDRDRRALGAIPLVFAAVGVALVHDAARPRNFSVLTMGAQYPETGELVRWPIPGWVPWLVAAVMTAAVAGLAMYRNTRSALVVAVTRGEHVTRESQRLHEEMVLAQERTRIARDMHDTLAGSLSQIALLAGGLQVTSTEGPERTANTASLIRHAAHEASAELKKVIGVLRGPADGGTDAGAAGLDAVSDLVGAARSGGMHVTLQTDVAPGVTGPLTNNVVVRVVQEALVNARKHAAGGVVHVGLRGTPADGVRVWIRNPMGMPSAAAAHGSGTGLQGMAERVRGIGGTIGVGPRGAEFVVDVWVPWHV